MAGPSTVITNSDVILTPRHTYTLYRFDSAGDRCPSGPNVPQFEQLLQVKRCVGFDPNQLGPRTSPRSKKLTGLYLYGTGILKTLIPNYFFSRHDDHTLRCDSNPRTTRAHFTGSIPREIGALVALTNLNLYETKVEGASGL